MNTAINEAVIANGADGSSGANANGVNEAFKELYSCQECDELNRYYKKESNWVQLAVLPSTVVRKIQDGEIKDFGNKLLQKALLLVHFINLCYPVVDKITTLLEYIVDEVSWDKTRVKKLVHCQWIQVVCQGVILLR